ncbi:unnamed protein product [Heterosigma akashiwo]
MARQLDELYDLRDQHNDLLMNILGEEQEAEAQREGLLASVPAGNERRSAPHGGGGGSRASGPRPRSASCG